MANKKTAKSRARSAGRAASKLHPATLALAVLFLAVGIAAGIFVSEALTADDCFVLNGNREMHLALGEAYAEPGATVLSFGRDISDKVQVGGDFDRFDAETPGVYRFVYTVDDLRWGEYRLVRTVVVSADADGASAGASAGAVSEG